jgi:hypothetical protein
MIIKFFNCQVWPPKINDQNLLGNKKHSFDGSIAIIDWMTKSFQVVHKIFFWSKLEKNLVAQFGNRKLEKPKNFGLPIQ